MVFLPGCPSEGVTDRVRATEQAVAVPAAPPAPAVERPSAHGPSTEGLVLGQTITLRGDAKGVPLHADKGSQKVTGRAPSGTIATLLGLDPGSNWLQIEEPSKRRSWIVRRYVAGASSARRGASATKVAPPEISDSPWSSKQACLRWAKEPRISRTNARIGTFNVEWFPDGKPGKRARLEGGTDLEWLACAIASLEVDAVAVQEFKTLPRARESVRTMLAHLDGFTSGKWQAAFDDCPSGAVQHVGVLYDSLRVTASPARTIAELNPHGAACKDSLRPGLGLTLSWPGQPEVQLVSVHFKSGPEARAIELRSRSFATMASLFPWSAGHVVVAGDLNTMGCPSCTLPSDAAAERGERAQVLAQQGLSLVPLGAGCSLYYQGEGHLLDGFVLSPSLKGATTQLAGLCAEQACQPTLQVEKSAANHELSDHCPLVLQLPF